MRTVRIWNVVDKIQRAKVAGTFDDIVISELPPSAALSHGFVLPFLAASGAQLLWFEQRNLEGFARFALAAVERDKRDVHRFREVEINRVVALQVIALRERNDFAMRELQMVRFHREAVEPLDGTGQFGVAELVSGLRRCLSSTDATSAWNKDGTMQTGSSGASNSANQAA